MTAPGLDEQAVACEDHREPEDQDQQERRQDRRVAVGEHQKPRARDLGARLLDAALERTLRVVCGR